MASKRERVDWHPLYPLARELHLAIEEWDDYRGGAPHGYGPGPDPNKPNPLIRETERPCGRCMEIAHKLEELGVRPLPVNP